MVSENNKNNKLLTRKVDKNTIIGISLVINLILAGALIFTLFKKPAEILPKPAPQGEIAEPLKAGEVGEISEEEMKEKGILPLTLVIFNTSGVISEVKSDRLIVQGSGSNFADQQPRELTVIFTTSTTTFGPTQGIKYQGEEGLKYLKIGEKISIAAPENIRGKTQFIVDYINKI